ncbi:Uncharacterised protein [Corynebacterium kutscheri]|nr:Uncharacterised protein [Corynebacterium kutscheri]VEH80214.1 Uncharacterised protein [Corynebacterium kutscheri]
MRTSETNILSRNSNHHALECKVVGTKISSFLEDAPQFIFDDKHKLTSLKRKITSVLSTPAVDPPLIRRAPMTGVNAVSGELMSKNKLNVTPFRQITTAILVDGGFYQKRAAKLFGHKTPEDRADELVGYCRRHIKKSRAGLYRIYYYDCPPSQRVVYHPLLQKSVDLGKKRTFHLDK